MSASRNVPVRGQPIACPVSASASSIVRRVVRVDHLLAQDAIRKRRKRRDQRWIALRRRDHFQQFHVARRIEEMRSEEPFAARPKPRGNLLHRQA